MFFFIEEYYYCYFFFFLNKVYIPYKQLFIYINRISTIILPSNYSFINYFQKKCLKRTCEG